MEENIMFASVLLFENKIVSWGRTMNHKPTIHDLDIFGNYKEKETEIEIMGINTEDFTEKEIEERFKHFFSRWDIHEEVNIKSPLEKEEFVPKDLNSIKRGEYHPYMNQKFWYIDFLDKEGVNCSWWNDNEKDRMIKVRFGVHKTKEEAINQFKEIKTRLGI